MIPGLTLRPFSNANRGERGFILSTWVRSYGAHRANVSEKLYAPMQGKLCERILSRAGVRIVVACSVANSTTLHGWACGERGAILHYVYVPPELRHRGLARDLMSEALGEYPARIETTHHWPSMRGRFVFNPYPLMEAA